MSVSFVKQCKRLLLNECVIIRALRALCSVLLNGFKLNRIKKKLLLIASRKEGELLVRLACEYVNVLKVHVMLCVAKHYRGRYPW